MTKQLLVESIRLDGGTQSRARVNEETVSEYAEAMKAPPGARPGPVWPPVTVFFDGTEYWLADGFHRVLAAIRAGRKHIAAEVKQGTREDAAWASCAANQTHGLRRSNADKRKAAEIAVRLHPEMTDGAIAQHCGLSQPFVGTVRGQVKSVMTCPPPARRVGRDGKSYPAPPSRTDRRESAPPTRDASRTPAAPPAPPVAAAEPPARVADGPVDDVGRRIPEHLVELWGRRQEVQDLLMALSRVRVALREAQNGRDPLFSEIPFSSALAHLDQAYDAVQVAKPYAVCAFCQGHGCKACAQRGLLGKFRWDTSVPKEHKEAVARMIAKERAA